MKISDLMARWQKLVYAKSKLYHNLTFEVLTIINESYSKYPYDWVLCISDVNVCIALLCSVRIGLSVESLPYTRNPPIPSTKIKSTPWARVYIPKKRRPITVIIQGPQNQTKPIEKGVTYPLGLNWLCVKKTFEIHQSIVLWQ